MESINDTHILFIMQMESIDDTHILVIIPDLTGLRFARTFRTVS